MAKQEGRKLIRRNKWADMLAAIILCSALLALAFWLNGYVRSKMLDFTAAENGSIALSLPGEMLVFRHEYVLNAPAAGEFVPAVAEGERVKEGTIVGYCDGVPLYAPKGGVISYELDGWEEALQIDLIYEMDLDYTFSLLAEQAAAETDQQNPADDLSPVPNQTAGRPVARLLDNLLDYTIVIKLRDDRDLLAETRRLQFVLADSSSYTQTIRERGETAAGDDYFVLTMSSSEDKLSYIRYSSLEAMAKNIQGVLIPSSAVTVNDEGVVGVFIQRKRKLVFTPITELTSRDGYSIVEGIGAATMVVTNPSKAYDGQRIY